MSKRPQRLGVTVTDEMYKALEEESQKNFNAPISALVRQAIEQWLEERGHELQEKITWGGHRRQAENELGEFAGALAS